MLDATTVYDWAVANPGHSWVPLLALCVVALLIYEAAKSLLPGLIKGAASALGSMSRTRRARLIAEQSLRRHCIASRNVNWVGALPALAQYDINIPLVEVFVAPRLQLSRNNEVTRLTVPSFLAAHRFACISGAPGSGKSTLLNFIAVAYAKEDAEDMLGLNEARIPLCLDCRDFPQGEPLGPAPELLSKLLARRGVQVGTDHILKMLQDGRCALLLDGLDEAGGPAHRHALLEWLLGVASSYSDENRFLITCRDIEWEGANLPGIVRARILAFTPEAAQNFIDRWRKCLAPPGTVISPGMEARLRHLQTLADELDGDYDFLYANPMLLTLAAVLLTIDRPLPRKRTEVLEAFVLAMLGDWSNLKDKRQGREEAESALRILRKVALPCMTAAAGEGVVLSSDVNLAAAIRAELGQEVSPLWWLRKIAAGSGLIQSVSSNEFRFTNRRIFEFLVASELALQPALWRAYWENPVWKDILMFLPELVTDKVGHLRWIQAQGALISDLQALFLLNAALECPEKAVAQAAQTEVRDYLVERLHAGGDLDEDLCRRYMRADHDWFMDQFDKALVQIDADPWSKALVNTALRAGYGPAGRSLATRLSKLPDVISAEILHQLPTFRLSVQRLLVPGVLDLNLPDTGEFLAQCGPELIPVLAELARKATPKWRDEAAIEALAEFQDSAATTLILALINERRTAGYARAALARHIIVISDDVNTSRATALVDQRVTFYQVWLKPCLDQMFAAALLVMLLPMMIFIAMIVALSSPGPVFFGQAVVGQHGTTIQRWKYRTMFVDEDGHRVRQAARSDARVTALGRFLRASSLDELPGLFSILRGDMSFIGPRPTTVAIAGLYSERHPLAWQIRLRQKPGLAGLAAIDFASSGTVASQQEAARDIFYAANCSFALDAAIAVRAVGVLLFSHSAY